MAISPPTGQMLPPPKQKNFHWLIVTSVILATILGAVNVFLALGLVLLEYLVWLCVKPIIDGRSRR